MEYWNVGLNNPSGFLTQSSNPPILHSSNTPILHYLFSLCLDGGGPMGKQIFEGINIVEFAAIAAGPLIGKHMADHGARVVHVESYERPDGFRQNYPPYKDK